MPPTRLRTTVLVLMSSDIPLMEPQSKMVASEQPAETEETKPPHLVPINGKDRPPKEKMELTSRVAITVLPHLLLVVLACCTFVRYL